MTTLLLAIAFAKQQTVSFTYPCANSAVVLDALGKQLGIRLEPAGSVKQDCFLISFHNVSKNEALNKIASTLNATWEEKDGVNYLKRTHQQELAEKAALLKREAQAVQAWLDRHMIVDELTVDRAETLLDSLLPLAKQPQRYDRAAENQYSSLEGSSPVTRYAYRLAAEIGAAAIAQSYESDPIVFTLNPTGNQRRFPNGQATKLFEKETAALKQALNQTKTLEQWPKGARYSTLVTPFLGANEDFFVRKNLQLTVRNNGRTYYFLLDVPGYRSTALYINSDTRDVVPLPKALTSLQDPYVPSDFEKAITPPIKTLFLAFGGQHADFDPVSEEQAKILNDPVDYEPLTLLGSKWMLDSAALLKRNIIAVLGDEGIVLRLAGTMQARLNLGQLWSIVPGMAARYIVTDEDGWITVQPSDPAMARDAHIDRVAWRHALVGVKAGKTLDIDMIASFAVLGNGGDAMVMSVLPAALQQGFDFFEECLNADTDVMRFYGLLDPRYRKMAKNGGAQIPASALSQSQTRILTRLIGRSSVVISSLKPNRDWGKPDSFFFNPSDMRGDEAVAQGLPSGAVLRVKVMRQNAIYRQPSDNNARSRGETAAEIGRQIASAEVYPNGSEASLRPYFAVAPAEQLYLEVEFPGVGSFSKRVQVDHLPSNAVYMTLKELPEDVQKEIETYVVKDRAIYQKSKSGGGGGS